DIRDLARRSSFEEVVFLLLQGRLPNRAELESARAELAAARPLAPSVLKLLRSMPEHAPPMDVLRTAVSYMSGFDPERDDSTQAANMRKALRITAQLATIVATYERIRKGQRVLRPDPTLGHAEDFVRMVTGKRPDPTWARMMDVAMVLYAAPAWKPPPSGPPSAAWRGPARTVRPPARGVERRRHVLPDRHGDRGDRRRRTRVEADLPERRLLLRARVPSPRDLDRPLHPGLRALPGPRLDGPRPGVLGGQPTPPAPGLVRRPEGPRLRPPRRAGLRRPDAVGAPRLAASETGAQDPHRGRWPAHPG